MKTFYKISLALVVVFLFASCKKESPAYSFTVKVTNDQGVALPNIFVEASADVPNSMADFSGKTNDNGEVTFSYNYEAVLKVRATRGSNPPSWMGCNFVKLEANNTVVVKVVVQPYDPSQPGC